MLPARLGGTLAKYGKVGVGVYASVWASVFSGFYGALQAELLGTLNLLAKHLPLRLSLAKLVQHSAILLSLQRTPLHRVGPFAVHGTRVPTDCLGRRVQLLLLLLLLQVFVMSLGLGLHVIIAHLSMSLSADVSRARRITRPARVTRASRESTELTVYSHRHYLVLEVLVYVEVLGVLTR